MSFFDSVQLTDAELLHSLLGLGAHVEGSAFDLNLVRFP